MKFCRVVVEKHAPFREGRNGKKVIHSQFLGQLRMGCMQLGSHNFSQPWRKFCKTPGFFASLNFLMYYFNKRLKPTTECIIAIRKKHIRNRYRAKKKSLYRHHVCFAIFVRALPRISTSAFSHLKRSLESLLITIMRVS